jgi:hypothetical protein
MTYDHWKTTEPEPSAPWAECCRCHTRDFDYRMVLVQGRRSLDWYCADCADREDPR